MSRRSKFGPYSEAQKKSIVTRWLHNEKLPPGERLPMYRFRVQEGVGVDAKTLRMWIGKYRKEIAEAMEETEVQEAVRDDVGQATQDDLDFIHARGLMGAGDLHDEDDLAEASDAVDRQNWSKDFVGKEAEDQFDVIDREAQHSELAAPELSILMAVHNAEVEVLKLEIAALKDLNKEKNAENARLEMRLNDMKRATSPGHILDMKIEIPTHATVNWLRDLWAREGLRKGSDAFPTIRWVMEAYDMKIAELARPASKVKTVDTIVEARMHIMAEDIPQKLRDAVEQRFGVQTRYLLSEVLITAAGTVEFLERRIDHFSTTAREAMTNKAEFEKVSEQIIDELRDDIHALSRAIRLISQNG